MSETEAFQDFVTTLESFKELKSGISGSRIKKLTTYALDHIEEGEKLISLIINYSKTCQDSHKLGSLYIIDSIGRAYLDEARSKSESIESSSPSGTFGHSLYVLTNAIEDLLAEAIAKSNSDHKDKIRVLVDIWDRSGLFPKEIINSIRNKYISPASASVAASVSSEDNNSSKESIDKTPEPLPEDPRERCIKILENIKPLPFLPKIEISDKLSSENISDQQFALFQILTGLQQNKDFLKQNVKVDSKTISSPSQQDQRQLSDQPSQQSQHVTTEYGSRRDRERERERYSSKRTRSRSPPRRSRDHSHNYSHEYMGSGSNSSTQSSNMATNNHHLYPDEVNVPSNSHYRPKPVSYDPNLPRDTVKVLSRTLFIGGVPLNMKEWDIASILRPYAEVQSVILNNARKHAFVKVYSRREAEYALMNFNKDGSSPLRTRWGVGFGPRDCCDYQHGFSIIPMHRLTDADKKWSVSAQWGGTSGEPLVPGICFEEPDIVVGEGVSSKAISQKMPTDSNRNGPRSGKGEMVPTQNVPQYGAYPPEQRYSGYPPQQNMGYNQPMPQQGVDEYQQPPPPLPPQQQQQQPQQSFDPTAHLNSLMSMLNQQQR
ncbi:hypothetical protein Kpol_2000p37 [Vanderwaltozyma polyspora DSM 70294]|uniref:CID domain-containing protein n=1 Tax=Vanderwaltozyma polyspora (strain ATCC 22028 / DSM 70294 / BCRC 21397 / CBS 2163 / NBRC 10782 / NRRL Y-8283 / UCD 57-17) TaxID=436907 RepID=A7TF47_VANPO|nr:uncharacterized protein Kpol_2000p37 [Vanderwaltozyma polyspora DSM 70294]EDO19072.1 hypothetical protein Kpol_2000p37 [Vanderwaltozyma polyspora DSM 70294]